MREEDVGNSSTVALSAGSVRGMHDDISVFEVPSLALGICLMMVKGNYGSAFAFVELMGLAIFGGKTDCCITMVGLGNYTKMAAGLQGIQYKKGKQDW